MKHPWRLAFVCACVTGNAGAVNLLDVYDRSLTEDPLWQQAAATQMAIREDKTQALIDMLPLEFSANKTWGAVGNVSLNTPPYASLTLSVNLFSWDSWVALKSADAKVAQGEANYQAAAQNLIQRVSRQYFSALAAQDALGAQERALQSVQGQLDQAVKNYEAGLISRVDAQAARAAHDIIASAVIQSKRALATQLNLLRAITNESYSRLAAPGDDMPLLTPDPTSEDAWVRVAMTQNASLTASRLQAEVAHDTLLAAYGGHLPRINLSASRNWTLGGGNLNEPITSAVDLPNIGFPIGGTDTVWGIGITVPIFSEGMAQSKVRQASHLWDAAKAGTEYTLRQIEEQTRDSYQGVISQIAQVQSLRRAVESNRVSLQAAQSGYDAGTKTVTDVLTSRDALVQTELSYAQAKYDYLNEIVSLRLAAGNLDHGFIEQINSWLVDPQSQDAPAAH